MATTTIARGERIDYSAILDQRTKLFILAGALLSLFLAALDQTIVATALPAIIRDFSAIDLISWVSTGYLLASTAMVPIYGKLSDLYGRKTILLWGIVIFLIGSMLCGIAASMVQLIVFRVIQGIGAAALTSTAFAVPADLFTPAERPRYMGLFGSVFGLSSVMGPFLGGFLTDQFGWHWVFFVNLPFGLLALGFVLAKMPRLASGLRARIDWLGTVLLITAVVPLMLGLTLDKSIHSWTSPLILGMFAVAAVATGLFIYVESRVASPIISLALFRNRTFAVGVSASVLNGAAFFGAILFLSLFMVNVLGMSATQAGTAQIPLMLAFVVSSNVASLIVQRVGRYKPFILAGFALMLAGFVLLTQMSVDTTMWGVTWRMIVLGMGLGPALPLLNLALQNAVSFNQIGSATASRQFFQQLGQVLGGAVFGVVLATTLTTQLEANLTPVAAELPPAARAALDPSQFRNSVSAGEGAAPGSPSPEQAIGAAIRAPFAEQRRLLAAALHDADAEARAMLLADPQTPEAVREILQAPASGAEQLDQALAALDAAEAQAVEQAGPIGREIEMAVRLSFADSITRIYFYAIWLVLAALLLVALFLPEVALRTTNRPEMPAVE